MASSRNRCSTPTAALKETSSGRVALSAPRQFRWEYTKPYSQLIVADGTRVWVYDPDLQQVTRRAQGSEEQNSPLAALIDPAKLDRRVHHPRSRQQGWPRLAHADPENCHAERLCSARLGFNTAGLATMQVIDSLGQKTTHRLQRLEAQSSVCRRHLSFRSGQGRGHRRRRLSARRSAVARMATAIATVQPGR